MSRTNWSGHLVGHPLVGRWLRLKGREPSAYTVGQVAAVMSDPAGLLVHFEHWLRWVPVNECEPWGGEP